MTVGELKEILKDVDDNRRIGFAFQDSDTFIRIETVEDNKGLFNELILVGEDGDKNDD